MVDQSGFLSSNGILICFDSSFSQYLKVVMGEMLIMVWCMNTFRESHTEHAN